jgi:hypothetical protein
MTIALALYFASPAIFVIAVFASILFRHSDDTATQTTTEPEFIGYEENHRRA